MSAQAEAYVRKKPKRIIQNQVLIVAIMCAVVVGTIPLSVVIFWLVFGVAPIVIPSILVVWAVSSVSYAVMRVHVERQNRKS